MSNPNFPDIFRTFVANPGNAEEPRDEPGSGGVGMVFIPEKSILLNLIPKPRRLSRGLWKIFHGILGVSCPLRESGMWKFPSPAPPRVSPGDILGYLGWEGAEIHPHLTPQFPGAEGAGKADLSPKTDGNLQPFSRWSERFLEPPKKVDFPRKNSLHPFPPTPPTLTESSGCTWQGWRGKCGNSGRDLGIPEGIRGRDWGPLSLGWCRTPPIPWDLWNGIPRDLQMDLRGNQGSGWDFVGISWEFRGWKELGGISLPGWDLCRKERKKSRSFSGREKKNLPAEAEGKAAGV